MYTLWVGCGIVAALVVWRLQPRDDAVPGAVRASVQLAAIVGAVAGAHLLQWPASALAWTDPALRHWHPLAGRTVLGGLLGAWFAVELAKRLHGFRGATGDGFAAPLAAALACGRLGCWSAGCCAGRPCAAWYALPGGDGVERVPVQGLEALWHAGACLLLVVAARRGWLPGRRLAAYLLGYAAVRFVLEWQRLHPPVLGGLTWYQLLALVLAALCATTLWRRRGGRAPPATVAGPSRCDADRAPHADPVEPPATGPGHASRRSQAVNE